MKIKEQLTQAQHLWRQYREATTYLVMDRVKWTEPRTVSRIGGMPPAHLRVGLVECSEPFVILHLVDSMDVFVLEPHQVACWTHHAVDAFPELVAFLRKYGADKQPVSLTHYPGEAWIRKQPATK